MIIRKNGKNQAFINVIEIHGNYDPINEFSTNSYPALQQIKLLQNDPAYTNVEITYHGKKLQIAQCNNNTGAQAAHVARGIRWTGPFIVLFDGKKW